MCVLKMFNSTSGEREEEIEVVDQVVVKVYTKYIEIKTQVISSSSITVSSSFLTV